MSTNTITSVNWSDLFKKVRKTIENDELPYVTRVSLRFPNHEQKRAFHVLVATIISLRTKDKTTEEASERLFKLANTPKEMLKLSPEKIAATIKPSLYYRNKAKQIHTACQILLEKYQGNVPHDMQQLLELPGVGRKTANLVLTEGFDTYGICVDTHVHRILNRLAIVNTHEPDQTEMVLREILPKRYWKKINLWLVMFGIYHCKPVGPKCFSCLLEPQCPSALTKQNP